MNYKQLGSLCLSLILLGGLFSCGNQTSEEKKDQAAEEFDRAESDLKEQIQEVVYEIPSPSEIPFLLEATGAEFNQSLINDNNKADRYASRNDKAALNLGIYAADIGYLVSYDKVQEALTYMSSAKKLADNLGVTGAFDTQLIKRFESNLSRKDSLSYLLNETIHHTEAYLKDDDRNKLAALIITGSFIEGLYISTELIKTYPKDILPDDSRNLVLTPLIRVVLEQEKSLKDLIKMLGTVENSAPVDKLITDLRELEKDYDSLNIADQIQKNRADLVLTDDTLAEITSKVAEIRNSITE
ncbi:hypothetical protein C900_05257 [Fulvivirga imtechensis AK7]|uniref:Lipoprotein n=1 Tax=Fulvivirga imtechensis AK7 TaxID=1237149 RepID=L8JYG6_9BACT|nr:hypothetical protein [Fulvivirga imtechensis]ELR73208.1 hypothetical protein C900_05257 [Fulvivirga imtechensis AK7]